MAATIALIGAGGKMGSRITEKLVGEDAYTTLYCETGEAGIRRLRERGLEPVASEDAVPRADFVILAVPDRLIGEVSGKLVPLAKPKSTVLLLDPAAAAAGEVAAREDVNFAVTHPCHPPLFGEQPTDEARRDFFGGVAAWQDIVIALMQGDESSFPEAEKLARTIFAPVQNAHRVTVEQMAILEPTMAEVVAATAAVLMKEAMEEAVKRGVPRPAAEAFMMGHAQVPLAIAFGTIDSPFSEAAKIAVRWGTERIIRPDWRDLFEPDQVKSAIRAMLHPEEPE